MISAHRGVLFLGALLLASGAGHAQTADSDARARALVKQMTPDERILLLHGYWSRTDRVKTPLPPGALQAAGFTPGIARLGIPALHETDASLGVAWISGLRKNGGTALP